MKFSNQSLKILKMLEDRGYSAYLVGGCVRDNLLNKCPKDEDVTTSAKPDKIKEIFKDYKVIETGLKHGTVTVVFEEVGFEITTMRIDQKYSDHRHPDSIQFTDNIVEDLSRRDFTINAIAWNKGLIDPFDGKLDLNNKLIKAVGNPDERFQEDALRMMRAVRFCAQLGFNLDDRTKESIFRNAHLIQHVSKERIRDEMCKILVSKNPHLFKYLYDLGLLNYISEDLAKMFECNQNNPYHIYDVGTHSLVAVRNVPDDLVLRVTMLLHDVGKPIYKTTSLDGVDHFYGHPEKSVIIAERFLREYKFTNKQISEILPLIKNHDTLGYLWRSKNWKKKVRRFLLENQDKPDKFFLDLIQVKKADLYAHNSSHPDISLSERYLHLVDNEFDKYIGNKRPRQIKDLALNGYDIMDIGVDPKYIKQLQLRLLRIVIDDEKENDYELLKSHVKQEYKQLLNQIRKKT